MFPAFPSLAVLSTFLWGPGKCSRGCMRLFFHLLSLAALTAAGLSTNFGW